ncbi:MAG: hypothetical protein IJS46_06605, partial [Kiritimatiellae bacterium]|nr:hypothetical protein [Kiritimatiellia bacterium]
GMKLTGSKNGQRKPKMKNAGKTNGKGALHRGIMGSTKNLKHGRDAMNNYSIHIVRKRNPAHASHPPAARLLSPGNQKFIPLDLQFAILPQAADSARMLHGGRKRNHRSRAIHCVRAVA